MGIHSFTTAVSFATTPVSEVSSKHDAIVAAGLKDLDRGDPWSVMYRKEVGSRGDDEEREIREIMGYYWLDGDAMAELVRK